MPGKYRVEIAPSAREDIVEILDYIAADSPAAADSWLETLFRFADTLEQMPHRCPAIPEQVAGGAIYRHLIYGDYRLIFRVDAQAVWIVRIVHGARILDSSSLEL